MSDFVTFVLAPSTEQHPKSIDAVPGRPKLYQCRSSGCCEKAGGRTTHVYGKPDPTNHGESHTAVWQCGEMPPVALMRRGIAGAQPITGGARPSTLDKYQHHWRFTFYLGDFTDFQLLAKILPPKLVERAKILAAAKKTSTNCPIDYRTGKPASSCATYFSDTTQGEIFRKSFPKGSRAYTTIATKACRNDPFLYNCMCHNRHLYDEFKRMKRFPGIGPEHCWFVPCSEGLSDFFTAKNTSKAPCRGAECLAVIDVQSKDATLKNNSIVQQCKTLPVKPTKPVKPVVAPLHPTKPPNPVVVPLQPTKPAKPSIGPLHPKPVIPLPVVVPLQPTHPVKSIISKYWIVFAGIFAILLVFFATTR